MIDNKYTLMQKSFYSSGTSNHEEHNDNPDYWSILLGEIKESSKWKGKSALDFACGKGRNVTNLHSLAEWSTVDGVDISESNINFCKNAYLEQDSKWFCNNGVDLNPIEENQYDFVMSTIALQHIPVYEIRRSIMTEILRVLKSGGLFSFQMGFGPDLMDTHGRPRSSYYDNSYNASGTNADHDVRVQSEDEIKNDLAKIGFVDIETTIASPFSDFGHPNWIYVKCKKS